ncbi:hypothetical protein GYA54_02230 [Candidatus Kuenenbacteria bacterium]|nr:hypothetical protein [Candidatus Kuenenbacteria bacterium]
MARRIAEQSQAFSIFWLKKYGYLNKDYSLQSGGITWTHNFSGDKNGINFYVYRDDWGTEHEDVYIKLKYIHTDYWSGEKNDIELKVPLAKTHCYFGGVRYWFKCPLYKKGIYCGRRVGVLYGTGKYFGCRYCANIAYQAQFEGGKYRVGSVCETDVERAYNKVKRIFYNGKPTKRYLQYLKVRNRSNAGWIKMANKFDYLAKR